MNPTIEITTPAKTTALTTLDRVKLELGINNDANDVLLTARVAAASSLIDGMCWPSLKRETVIERFYPEHWGECAEYLILDRSPAAQIIGVTADGVSLTAAESDYYYGINDQAEWRLDGERRRLYRQATTGRHKHWSFCNNIAVAYVGGYLLPGQEGRDLPVEIEEACVELVSGWWLSRGRDPGLRARENVGVSRFEYQTTTTGLEYGLPEGVALKLKDYLRKDMVW